MRILMLVATSVATDTRVLREAVSLVDDGHRVHIIGRQVPPSFVPPEGVSVSSVGSGSVLRPAGSPSLGVQRQPWPVRVVRWLLLPEHRNQAYRRWGEAAVRSAAELDVDVIHAHDFTALVPGSRLAATRGVPLVYDSHEYWSGRPRIGRPTPWQRTRERRVEARLGRAAAAVITVGDGIADALRSDYGWPRVIVVRNSFDLSTVGQPPARPRELVYTGRLSAYRELEVIAAASERLELPVRLVGPADESWLSGFDARQARVEPALPVAEVTSVLTEAGLALVTHSDRWANHRLALPNKLFHAVAAGVPVVATDVGELGAIVRRHGIGTLYRPGDPDALVRAVRQAHEQYPHLCEAVRHAATELSWAGDRARLTRLYRELAESRWPATMNGRI